jgi:hypothetical protein
MLVINFIFGLLWTGRGSSVSSVAFLGFHELNRLNSMALGDADLCFSFIHLISDKRLRGYKPEQM